MHFERPNYDFAQYLAGRTGGFDRQFGEVRAVARSFGRHLTAALSRRLHRPMSPR
jgi:hypothetical protein